MRRFFDRSGILFTLTFLLYILVSGCSENRDSLSTAPLSQSQARRYHFDPRPNPLQTYIQTNWTNGSAVATGGSNYSHIKIYGHTYHNLAGYQDAADFVAQHFDMFLGRQFLRSDNKRVLVLAKVMGPNESLGAGTGTTIALNGSYKKVLPDFTLGPTINQITLLNNEGVILVKQTGPGCKDCDPEG